MFTYKGTFFQGTGREGKALLTEHNSTEVGTRGCSWIRERLLDGRRSRKCRSRESGLAIMEFGLILPVVALIVIGGLEVAGIFMAQRQLLGAATTGARIGSTEGGTTSDVTAAVTTFLSSTSIKNNFTTSISGVASNSNQDTTVVVTVSHNYPVFFKIPMIPGLNSGTIPLSATVTLRHD